MCEIIKSLEASDWIDIITALIAAYSAYLLYKTFGNQQKSSKLQNENLLLDRKAKAAEYMPKFDYLSIKFQHPFDIQELPDGNIKKIYKIDKPTEFTLEIKTQDNIILLSKIEFRLQSKNKGEHYNYDIDYTEVISEYINNFINPQELKKFNIQIPTYSEYEPDESKEEFYIEIFKNNHTCFFRLTIEDAIGNLYLIIFKRNLYTTDTEIIEYKKKPE